jgi:uncharacterized membrane protein YgdD (TMEM256/DUF423 family)
MNAYNWIMISGFFGFTSVAFGAFGAHALKEKLDAYSMGVFQTAVQYHAIHAVVLFALSIWMVCSPLIVVYKSTQFAAACFTIGILVFSGSLYALALSQVKTLGAITPIGGVLFLLGWIFTIKLAWELKSAL